MAVKKSYHLCLLWGEEAKAKRETGRVRESESEEREGMLKKVTIFVHCGFEAKARRVES